METYEDINLEENDLGLILKQGCDSIEGAVSSWTPLLVFFIGKIDVHNDPSGPYKLYDWCNIFNLCKVFGFDGVNAIHKHHDGYPDIGGTHY